MGGGLPGAAGFAQVDRPSPLDTANMQSNSRQDVYQARRAFGSIFERLDIALQSKERLSAADDHVLRRAVEECAMRARIVGMEPEFLLAALRSHLEKRLGALPAHKARPLIDRIVRWAMSGSFRAD